MSAKPILRSKTLWFNIAALLIFVFVSVATPFGYDGSMNEDFNDLAQALVLIINIALRFATKQAVFIR